MDIKGRIFACSDFHGFKSLYTQICDFLEPEDHVIFLGDAADRGPHGWELIKLILDNPQWTYILGNHDWFFIQGIRGTNRHENQMLHLSNGGKPTLEAYKADLDPKKAIYIHRLSECDLDATVVNSEGKLIYLSHSGAYNPEEEFVDAEDFIWDRAHIVNDAPKGIDLIVHGHTTIPHLMDKLQQLHQWEPDNFPVVPDEWDTGTAWWYANGTKCDIDNCTIMTGACTLLNLDTFEEHAFFISEEEKEYLWD